MADERTTTERDLARALTESVAVLEQRHIQYAIIGGMAVSERSQPRFTKDVDFLLQIPQLALPPLLSELADRGFQFDGTTTIREWTQQHMTTLSYRGLRIDWMKPVLPIYQHVLDRATDEMPLGTRMRVASAEGLILLKLMAFRPQDQVDLANLVAAHAGRLDLAWIRSEWQTIFPLDDPRMKRLEELLADSAA